MKIALQRYADNFDILMPPAPDKDQYSRLLFFLEWLDAVKLPWYQPDLERYRDYLLRDRTRPDRRTGQPIPAPLAPATVKAHLATIRGRYDALLNDNRVRQRLYDALPPDVSDPASRKALVDEVLARLQNAVHPRNTRVPETVVQDRADSEHLRLSADQVRDLLRLPGSDSLPGLRDTAMLTLMVCTGIREAELVALRVDDLRQTLGGEMALRVRRGKGNKQRLVPYGGMEWCLQVVQRWLNAAEIHEGAVFRGLYKGNKTIRPGRISERAVNQMMYRYPILINGVPTVVQPHDLRRTYAYNAYLSGMDIERIRQNLGHASLQTTQIYIGTLDASQRRPPALFMPLEEA